ncbi:MULTISPECIES: carbohydrate ABC transporter permease [Cohnella]|uniref:carbohydrate ABC transporter permease n=1 Tax=Cohnella TaxID=329857 RepID=UPI00159370D7|nr:MULTISPECIES: carbohydrate ABC transporter permease [Cohnella]MBN2982891.1 carbohydrate ABC transporter permease [Cohnella algarum]
MTAKGWIGGVRLVFLAIWSVVVLVPLWMLLSIAFKTPSEFLENPFGLPASIRLDNFVSSWTQASLGLALGNSLLVTAISLAALVLFGSAAAYALARGSSRIHRALYAYFLLGLMVPFQIAMIPLYKVFRTFELINKIPGGALAYVAVTIPFVVFLFFEFVRALPADLEEAASIDGCGRVRAFALIVFPLLKPVTATVVITNCISIWNDFMVPLLFLQKSSVRTIPIAIYSFTGEYNNQWPLIFAGVVISSLPMVIAFLLLQKQFIKGMVSGAVKG